MHIGTNDERRAPIWFAVAIAITLAIGLVGALRLTPSPDISWPLLALARMLDGARYGRDILEVNPPLVVWLYSPALPLARLSGLPEHSVLALLTVAAAIGSGWAAARLLRPIEPHWRAIVLALFVAFLVLPASDFSQREHFAVILGTPWFALAAVRLSRGAPAVWVCVAVALAAGLGLFLKPYFLLPWLVVESAVLFRLGSRMLLRTENLVLVLAGVLYVATVLVTAPDYLPFVVHVRPLYSVYMTQHTVDALALCALVGVLSLLLVRAVELRPATVAFGGASLGFAAAGLVQMKWFGYHFLPAVSFLLVAVATYRPEPSDQRRRIVSLVGVWGLRACMVLLIARGIARDVDIALRPLAPENLQDPDLPAVRAAIMMQAPGRPVMVLSTNQNSSFPTVPLAGGIWASRLPSLWPLWSLYHEQLVEEDDITYRSTVERPELERWFLDVVYEDLVTWHPELIFVLRFAPNVRHTAGAHRFDYLTYFRMDDRIRAVLDQYEPLNDVGRYHLLKKRTAVTG